MTNWLSEIVEEHRLELENEKVKYDKWVQQLDELRLFQRKTHQIMVTSIVPFVEEFKQYAEQLDYFCELDYVKDYDFETKSDNTLGVTLHFVPVENYNPKKSKQLPNEFCIKFNSRSKTIEISDSTLSKGRYESHEVQNTLEQFDKIAGEIGQQEIISQLQGFLKRCLEIQTRRNETSRVLESLMDTLENNKRKYYDGFITEGELYNEMLDLLSATLINLSKTSFVRGEKAFIKESETEKITLKIERYIK